MARDSLKDIFQLLTSRLCEETMKIKEKGIYLWWFPRITCPNMYCENKYWDMCEWVIDYSR